MYGSILLRYGDARYESDVANFEVVYDPDDERTWDIAKKYDGFTVDEDDISEIEAKFAMKWVYENFYTLWD